MSEHLSDQEITRRVSEGQRLVDVGATYAHYKDPTKHYKVLKIGVLEATEEPCVIYQALYGSRMTWVRPLSSWLEPVPTEKGNVPRFFKALSSQVERRAENSEG